MPGITRSLGHDRRRLLRYSLEGLGPVASGGDLVSPEGEEVGHALPSEGIVLDDQYTLTHGNPALRAGLAGHGSRIGASGARAFGYHRTEWRTEWVENGLVAAPARGGRPRRGIGMTGLVRVGIAVDPALVGVSSCNSLVRARVRVDEA